MKNKHPYPILVAIVALAIPACAAHGEGEEHAHHEEHKIVATSPLVKSVTLTQQYVGQIHSQRHINVCALETGYLDVIPLKEGQAVKQGDVLFRVVPTLYQAKLDAELAEAKLAELEFNNAKRLLEQKVVSPNEVAIQQAKLDKATAKAKIAAAELNFTVVRAPFDGIVDRLHVQQGSLVKEGEVLTTLSDNSTMWVYFNVPEVRYLEYKNATEEQRQAGRIELKLANATTFPHPGRISAIEAKFNNETGNIPFRADFANPQGLLRHGQTGNILIHRELPNALVIPQRATFEILDKYFVFVVGADGVVHQREITLLHEMEDVFVVKGGINKDDKIVLEGVRQVRDGQKLDCEFRMPETVLADQKHRAE